MAEQFDVAALRHLQSAARLEEAGQLDDAGYHYGIAGETAVKQSVVKAIGHLPKKLRKHINERGTTLQEAVKLYYQFNLVMSNGRLGGALARELANDTLVNRFVNWSLNIRYADTDHCPINQNNLMQWKSDAITLINAGVF